jgi:hypothetical protein
MPCEKAPVSSEDYRRDYSQTSPLAVRDVHMQSRSQKKSTVSARAAFISIIAPVVLIKDHSKGHIELSPKTWIALLKTVGH